MNHCCGSVRAPVWYCASVPPCEGTMPQSVRLDQPRAEGWDEEKRRVPGVLAASPPLNSHPPLTNPLTPHHTFNCPPQTLCPPSPQWGGGLERSWCGLTSISWSMLGVPLSPLHIGEGSTTKAPALSPLCGHQLSVTTPHTNLGAFLNIFEKENLYDSP